MTTGTAKKIVTSICPTCGCSLVRLGIGEDRWTTTIYEGKKYFFCCQGCTDLFDEDPPRYLKETKDLVVCPTCLAEKPVQWTVRMEKVMMPSLMSVWRVRRVTTENCHD